MRGRKKVPSRSTLAIDFLESLLLTYWRSSFPLAGAGEGRNKVISTKAIPPPGALYTEVSSVT